MATLHLIGIDPRGLSPAAREAIGRSTCVFCTGRFRELLGDFRGEVLAIAPLAEALEGMAARLVTGDITVLASGDPLFFGIGRTLIERFGAESVIVHPALSAMQLAFAHCKAPWEDAAVLSLHGRGDQEILALLLRRHKLFLFTDRHHRPEIIADDIARGLTEFDIAESSCRIMVAENLGLSDERITHGSPSEIAAMGFGDLNVMIARLRLPFGNCGNGPLGLTEQEISHSRGLISKDEIRAAILHRLRLPHTGVLWDIGAGSGSISVEAARLCPELTVYAIERHPDGQANITANRKAFSLANLHLIMGEAPAALTTLPAPDRVFIGGSGGQLPNIVEAASRALKPGGIIMASSVTEATRLAAPRLFHQHGFRVECSTITVSRESYPPATGGPLFLNPITIITGTK